MKGKRIQLLLTWLAACINLLLFITPANGANIVIGGDYTDIGTIVFVSPAPGDLAPANGTALRNTLEGIADASATNPYLIKLGPGTYDLGATGLQMKQHVSIEGSGEKTTKVTATVSSEAWPPSVAAVIGADNAELRSLTAENTGTGTYTAAILNMSTSPLSLFYVTAIASGGTSQNYGVYNDSSSPTMTNVTAAASGAISFGIYNWYGASPTMTNVTATAAGTGSSTGINNNWAGPVTMTNVTAKGTGGTNSYGVSNVSCLPTMTNVTATGSGGTNNYGVYNDSASPTMTNVTATGSGGTNSYGVFTLSSGTIKINHSVITGTTHTISNGAGVTMRVGNTQLDGGAVNGALTCVGAYNGSFVALDTSCL